MSILQRYIEGWKAHDVEAVLNCLTDDCEIVESYGPIYRGTRTVRNWILKWSETGRIQEWEITQIWVKEDFEAAE